jgi:hypothetical protein
MNAGFFEGFVKILFMNKGITLIAFALVTNLSAKSDFKVHLIDSDNLPKNLVHELQHFESQFTYPFSNTENFTINHGTNGDYLAFFKGLGKPYYYIARATRSKQIVKRINDQDVIVNQQKDEIAAVICCVLREMTTFDGKIKKAWYICDLKVHQNYQGQHLPIFMAKKVAFWRYLQCPRGFAICMNPSVGEPKAASIFKKYGSWVLDTQVLNLYNLSASQVEQHKGTLKKILVDHGYMKDHQELLFVSTHGDKDYEITDTISQQKRPWHLIHIQAGEGQQTPLVDNATYMICAVEGTTLDNNFKILLGIPSSTAQIVSHGMKEIDFNYLTSSQI